MGQIVAIAKIHLSHVWKLGTLLSRCPFFRADTRVPTVKGGGAMAMSDERFLGTKDPPPPKEPWESPLERKARRHREKAGGKFRRHRCVEGPGWTAWGFASKLWGGLGMYIKPILDPITSYYNILFDRFRIIVDKQSGLSDSTIHQKNIKNPSDSLIFYFDPRLKWCRLKRCFLLLRFLDVDVLLYPSFRCFVPWKNMMFVVKTAGGGSQSRSEEDYRSLWPSQGRWILHLFAGLGTSSRVKQTN